MIRHITATIIVLVTFSNHLCGQEKYEKEHRLKGEAVPTAALDFIRLFEVENKIKWYAEEGLNSKSIEAKFKLNHQKYSIEFDTLGNLQDIEIDMKWGELQPLVKDSIEAQFAKRCSKYAIAKIQIQYSGANKVLLSKIKKGESSGEYSVRYEIVARCKNEKKTGLFEYLFNKHGQLLRVAKIVFKNSSNLEY